MKQNENFFDKLDNDWGSVISDTYKKNADILFFYESIDDLKIILDESTKKTFTLEDNHQGYNFKDKTDPRYDINISVYTGDIEDPQLLTIEMSIYDDAKKSYITEMTAVGSKTFLESYFNSTTSFTLNYEIIFNIIDESVRYINERTQTQGKPIPVESIESLKNIIKEGTNGF